jgi:hypothetical protein
MASARQTRQLSGLAAHGLSGAPPRVVGSGFGAFFGRILVGKKRSIRTDARIFDRVGDANTFYSVVLNRYALGDRVSDEEAVDLTALLKLHSEYAEKVGVGIDHFEVRAPPPDVPQHSSRCFWIVRTDGSAIDFSFKNCLAA